MERDDVTAGQQLIQSHIFHKILDGWIFVHIIGDDLHAEALADAAHCGADLSCADDTGGLLVKVKAHESAQTEIILTHLVVCLVQSAVCRESQCHRMLRHRLRRIAGNAHDAYAVLSGGIQIDIVKARTPHQDQSDPLVVQDRERPRTDIRAYKAAYRVEAFGESRCSGVEVGFCVFDFHTGKVFQSLLKRVLVIAFGVIKQNLHGRYLLFVVYPKTKSSC